MFYENFERICRQNATSPSAMALALGKNKSAASAWKSNGTIPKADELQQLAKLLNCRVSDFFDDPVDQVISIQQTQKVPKAETKSRSISHYFYSATEPKDIRAEKDPEKAPVLDDNIRDFILIYSRANNRQRNQLMSAVYDFEEKVLNNDGN